MNAIELFAGAGGLLLGTALAGFHHELAVEWNGPACDTLRLNVEKAYPLVRDMNVLQGDVRAVPWREYQGKVDLLAGGPPCQPFSLGGLARAALDERDMFPAMTQALAQCQPRAFIVENVKGLTRQSFSDYFAYILLRLEHPLLVARDDENWRDHLARLTKEHTSGCDDGLRYVVTYRVVDAADYGVAQHRHRVIMVGFRSDVMADWSFPEPTHSGAALWQAQHDGSYWERHGVPETLRASGVRKSGNPGLKPWRTVRDVIEGLPPAEVGGTPGWLNHELRPGARAYPGHTGSVYDEPSKAIKAGVHGVPGGENMVRYPDGSVRYYSVREAARIQGFPDRYEFASSWGESVRQIGNAVPVPLAQVVAGSVAVALEHDSALRSLDVETIEAEVCSLGTAPCL